MANFSSNLINKFEREVVSPNLQAGSLLADVVSFISENLVPEEVFSQKEMEAWAEDNGYTKSDKQ